MSLVKLCRSLNIKVRYYSEDHIASFDRRGVPLPSGCAAQDDGQSYILCARGLTPEEQRYTIAHELGHIVLGHLTYRQRERLTYPEYMETEANIFAAVMIANELSGSAAAAEDRTEAASPAAERKRV